MPFSVKQQEYLDNATHRWNIKTGATRSGKTFLDYATVIPKRILATQDNGLIVFLGNTQRTLERNIFEPMRKIYPASLVGNISSGTNTVMLFGKRCHAIGADNVRAVARIQGPGFEYCYGDEVATWNRDVFQMLKSRLDKPNSTFDGTANPTYPSHWLKTFLDSDADIYHQHYIIDDNPFLPTKFVENLKQEYEGTIYYDRYILGLWVRAEGLIYPYASQAVVKTEPRDYSEYQIAADYGIHNPTCYGLFGKANDAWYLVKEYYHSGRESNSPKTDDEYHDDLVSFAGSLPIRRVIIDPSASSFITLMRRRAKFRVTEADNAVLDGIRNTSTAIAKGMLFINDDCSRTIQEFNAYSWDDMADDDKPIKEDDHMMDAIRYFVQTNRLALPTMRSITDEIREHKRW